MKHPLFRRIALIMALFMGLFSQSQLVFACPMMDGKAKPVCCCDDAVALSTGCVMGDVCPDQAPGPAPAAGCCEVSYQTAPSVKAPPPVSANIQVLLLDAPQPPPLPVAFSVLDYLPPGHTPRPPRVSSRFAGTDTYLLTHRIRI